MLASIPGTPEARESLIANSIPQTAAVDRGKATLKVDYDGAPEFKPIDGTSLSFAWNTAVPVIQVNGNAYYAVDNGVWFTAASATGPWSVALDVPTVIYSIPPTSPLHYVTYVRVYSHTDNQVYVGYTPGYYGTVASNGVVVYGTGYPCSAGSAITGTDARRRTAWASRSAMTRGSAGRSGMRGDGHGPPRGTDRGGDRGAATPVYWGGGIATANIYGRWGNVLSPASAPRGRIHGPAITAARRPRRVLQRSHGRTRRRIRRGNTNIYTGTTKRGGRGMRYNPQTGRAVAGAGAAAVNPYTGNAIAGGGARRSTRIPGASTRPPELPDAPIPAQAQPVHSTPKAPAEMQAARVTCITTKPPAMSRAAASPTSTTRCTRARTATSTSTTRAAAGRRSTRVVRRTRFHRCPATADSTTIASLAIATRTGFPRGAPTPAIAWRRKATIGAAATAAGGGFDRGGRGGAYDPYGNRGFDRGSYDNPLQREYGRQALL